MEAIKKIVRIPANHEIKINIPRYLPKDETLEVILILKKKSENFSKKIQELKAAQNDPLFINDLKTISDDFAVSDSEGWGRNEGV